jgi:hypothetical protein
MGAAKIRRAVLLLATCLAVPATANAGPITSGVWSPVGNTWNTGTIFWDNQSGDCDVCNAGTLLNIIFGPLEYLHDGSGGATAFKFNQAVSYTKFGSLSVLKGTFSQQPDGNFTYDNTAGLIANSLATGWQFALFRQVGPQSTRYFIGVEDLPVGPSLLQQQLSGNGWTSDADFNDYMASFTLENVPEPSTLMLMGTAFAGFAARRLRRRSTRP